MSIEFVRDAHDEALYAYGEWTMFVLMWRIEDHDAGLVTRCSVCYTAYGTIAEVFKQPAYQNCPSCFGTTFEGGFRARIVRPALWDPNSAEDKEQQRGEVKKNSATVQSTSDFKLRVGDYLIRGDGTRWQNRILATNLLHDGFKTVTPANSNLGYIYGQVDLEDLSSVTYTIPVSDVEGATPESILTVQSHFLPDFSAHELVRDGVELI